MTSHIQLILTPEEAADNQLILHKLADKLAILVDTIADFRITKKSIDARTASPKINISLEYFLEGEEQIPLYSKNFSYQDVSDKEEVYIIGAGSAGLFAALKLIELGLKPILFERGKSAKNRYQDIQRLNANEYLNPDSNYSFGAGGGGMFSDGKLYTRSKRKGNLRELLETFHYHGAPDDILYENNPHIGSDLLPNIISNLADTIIKYGGEIHFETRLIDIYIENDELTGFQTSDGKTYKTSSLMLATGSSAYDIYDLLDKKNIVMESKDFAIGIRVEHPQQLIDSIQYKAKEKNPYLPAATYNLVEQVDGRAVYSFCMCPGGTIVHAGNRSDGIVVNGISSSKRNSPYANSGIVVAVRQEDIPEEYKQFGAFAALKYQEAIEHEAFLQNEGKGLKAPAQGLLDFVFGKESTSLPPCSYEPGIVASNLHEWLPLDISKRLQEAFISYDKKLRGFLTNQAVVVGVETRSTSCIRIPRSTETGEHIQIRGLFPVGEGSGYSGGITSSALDGINAANYVFEVLHSSKDNF